MKRTLAKVIFIFAVAWAATSCASISVSGDAESARQNRPEIVYVTKFTTERGDFAVDRDGPELADFKKNLQLMLQTGIATEITDKLLPAVPESKAGHDRNPKSWLVCGDFVTVKQGSRLLRGAIGFGAGGTKLETRVAVYDLSQDPTTPFLTFATTGGSNAEPGAILALTTDPLQLAIGGVSGVAHGLSEDTARTAREITAELSNDMYDRGWIPESQRIEPKHQTTTDTW